MNKRKYWYSDPLCGGAPIEADVRYAIPTVTCPICGIIGGLSMVRVPFFDPVRDGSPALKREWKNIRPNKVLPWDNYVTIAALLTSEVSRDDVIIAPGVSFGASVITVHEDVSLARIMNGIILITKSLLRELESEHIALQYSSVIVNSPKGPESNNYVELFAPAISAAHESIGATICHACGRAYVDWIPCNFDLTKIPKDVHLFRIKECPNAIIATEELVSILRTKSVRQHHWRQMTSFGSKVMAT